MKSGVQALCGSQIVSKRLLHNDSRILHTIRLGERRNHILKKTGRNGEIVGWAHGWAQSPFQALKGRLLLVIPAHVVEQAQEFRQSFLVNVGALCMDAVAHTVFELFLSLTCSGDANQWYIQVATLDEVIQGRKYFLIREVSHGSKQDQGIGCGRAIRRPAGCARLSQIWNESRVGAANVDLDFAVPNTAPEKQGR